MVGQWSDLEMLVPYRVSGTHRIEYVIQYDGMTVKEIIVAVVDGSGSVVARQRAYTVALAVYAADIMAAEYKINSIG